MEETKGKLGVSGLREGLAVFRGLGFTAGGLGSEVRGLGFRAWGSGFRLHQGAGLKVFGYRVQVFRVQNV